MLKFMNVAIITNISALREENIYLAELENKLARNVKAGGLKAMLNSSDVLLIKQML